LATDQLDSPAAIFVQILPIFDAGPIYQHRAL